MIDCISMYQPWAQWVALGWKTIETRRHNKLACLARRGKRIVIHASDKWDIDWCLKANDFLTQHQFNMTAYQGFEFWPRGALICTVKIHGHWQLGSPASHLALCDCSGGDLFGLTLQAVQRFDPIKWKGHQGIMKIPDEVIEKATRKEIKP